MANVIWCFEGWLIVEGKTWFCVKPSSSLPFLSAWTKTCSFEYICWKCCRLDKERWGNFEFMGESFQDCSWISGFYGSRKGIFFLFSLYKIVNLQIFRILKIYNFHPCEFDIFCNKTRIFVVYKPLFTAKETSPTNDSNLVVDNSFS